MRLIISTLAAIGLSAVFAGDVRADAAAGKAAFEAQKCTGCHYADGPAREKSIADQLAKKGPELWYAGSKFKKDWLNAWLQDPKPICALAYNSLTKKNAGDHPKLSGGDAGNMTDFLMSKTSSEVKAGTIKPKKSLKGKSIFNKKMPCTGCHQSASKKGKVSGGLSGPTLVGASKRLNPDWIYAYLKNPTHFKPFKAMPTFAGLLKDKDLKNVSKHVSKLK
ncbi:MAG: cytochrome c [Rhodospirillaceae bacterium]|nr:cytochrome c [Rhodospirillaceae bacterium]